MSAGFTIPMAQALLSDGRAQEVARMLTPMLEHSGAMASLSTPADEVLLRSLLARIQLLEYQNAEHARSLLEFAGQAGILAAAGPQVRAEWAVWRGWCELLDASRKDVAAAAVLLSVASRLAAGRNVPETVLWCNLGRALAAADVGAVQLASAYADTARRVQAAVRSAQADAWLARLPDPTAPPVETAAEMVGLHPPFRIAVEFAQRAVADGQPYLIVGERGTGRRHLARAMHALAGGGGRVFHVLRNGGADESLGKSLAQVVDAGMRPTLCLHDVEDLPQQVQQRAADAARNGRAHVVCTSTRDLPTLFDSGRVEQTLLKTIAPAQVHLPPLRSRGGDVELLVRYFLRTLRKAQGLPAAVTDDAMASLCRYAWPGNVRQLRNEIERALVHVQSEPAPVIRISILSPDVRGTAYGAEGGAGDEHDLDQILSQTEKAVIESVLAQTGGQVTAAAESLGLTRQGLYKKMKRLGVDPARYQNGGETASIEAGRRENTQYA